METKGGEGLMLCGPRITTQFGPTAAFLILTIWTTFRLVDWV